MEIKRLVFRKGLWFVLLIMFVLASCSAEDANDQMQSTTIPASSSLDSSASPFDSSSPEPSIEPTLDPPAEPSLEPSTGLSGQPSPELEEQKQQEDQPEIEIIDEIIKKSNLPDGFVYLDEMITGAEYDMRYYSEYNFVGARMDGYLGPFAIGTIEMAEALVAVSEELEELGYKLIIYDAYRPAKAVEQFISWSNDQDDIVMKEVFYPNEDKSKLFQRGYLSSRSGHSRGSTIDLTIAYIDTGEEVDMGSPYDLLDEISYFATTKITKEQAANRKLLKKVMEKYGFKAYSKEWWHYVLKDEPYPNTYFDFNIE